jgi:hypothetical protein
MTVVYDILQIKQQHIRRTLMIPSTVSDWFILKVERGPKTLCLVAGLAQHDHDTIGWIVVLLA